MVQDAQEYVPEYMPKTVNRGSFAFAGLPETGKPTRFELLKYGDEHRYLRMLGRSESSERVATKAAVYIANLAGKIGAPKIVEEEAMYRAKRLLKSARSKGRKLTADEVAAVALWCTCKVHGFTVSLKEYERICEAVLPSWRGSLLKLLNKTREIETLPLKSLSPKDYVRRFAGKLRNEFADGCYVDAVEAYAITLCDAVEDAEELAGKNPACIAAAALRLADERTGGWIGANKIADALGVGFNQEAYNLMRRRAPLPPEPLRKTALENLKKRVAEVRAHEMVRNAPY